MMSHKSATDDQDVDYFHVTERGGGMVLGFAVVAVFAVVVFSTIVATVNEMKKHPAPDYAPTPMDDPAEVPYPLPYRFSYQTANPNVTYTRYSPYDERFEVNEEPESQSDLSPDYVPSTEGSHRQTSYGQSASESQKPEYEYVDEDEEKIRKLAAYQLQLQLHQMKMNQKNPFAPPPFPSSGYGTAGLGYSSAGNGGTPSNKAFIPFFGYVDPVVLIAIVAFPVLCTLGVTSLLMPIIPIVIYIIGLIFPSTKKRNRLPASRINSRMRHATDPSAHFSDSISPQAIERMFRVLSQALDKF